MKRRPLFIPLIALMLAALACNMPGAAPAAAPPETQEIGGQIAEPGVEQAEPVEPSPTEEIPPTDTPEPPTAEPSPTATATPTHTPEPEGCTNRIGFVADVTVPDGADFDPGEAFTKTWRLRNDGTCTWTSSHSLVFSHGDAMGGPAELPLPAVVNPGQTVDLSVDLVAPDDPGGYKGFWMLRDPSGVLFGLGEDGDVAFWVEIEVLEPDAGGDGDGGGIFIITPIIPVFPLYKSSGTGQNLLADNCFDLDNGAWIGCGDGTADFRYDPEMTMSGFPPTLKLEKRLVLLHGAAFAGFGSGTPSSSDCQALGLSTSSFKIQSQTYCYRTSEGHYGYWRQESGDLFSVTFTWGTYSLP